MFKLKVINLKFCNRKYFFCLMELILYWWKEFGIYISYDFNVKYIMDSDVVYVFFIYNVILYFW